MTITFDDDNNQPYCPQQMTADDLRSDLSAGIRNYMNCAQCGYMHATDSSCYAPSAGMVGPMLNSITEVRHGQIAVYPQDRMKRLLAGEAKAPLLRRILRRLRLMK